MMAYVEQYRQRFGYYPKEVLADQIYCNRKNRKELKEKGIRLVAKPLGRPPAVKKEHLSPGERNPIEGKFGQAKTAYGLAKGIETEKIPANHGLPASSWCLTWSNWPGRYPYAYW